MKMLSALFPSLLSAGLLSVFAGQPDPRFEGIWKGVETYQVPAKLNQVGAGPSQKLAVIAIGDSGRILAVVQGLYPAGTQLHPIGSLRSWDIVRGFREETYWSSRRSIHPALVCAGGRADWCCRRTAIH